MKTSLDHLPESKRAQLADVVAALREHVPLELLILFGSHARGDWVDDYQTGYRSDFDLLAVVKTRALVDRHDLWHRAERLAREKTGSTALGLIIHDIKDVNKQLEKGSFFFADIKKEGVVLYDSGRFVLASEKDHTPEERLARARGWFRDWSEAADDFLRAFEDAMAQGSYKVAAFLLHQATERYYNTVQLCFTAYKPKLHNIEELGRRVVNLHPGFAGVFPRDTPEDDALFKQLKNAYIDSRYSRTYHITREELDVLRTRVLDLRERADRYGKEKLELPPSPVREPPRAGAALARAEGEARGKAEGLREGEAKGLREGEARGLRAAVLDLCELLGVEPTEEQRARLEAMGVDELEGLRAAIKRTRRWPA
ncbi:MAG TPA: HEPN domain-containing protein [Polyangiaceae bacterium]|nr:HEPN domain-containing protein [Polyangiaceae bacterium]